MESTCAFEECGIKFDKRTHNQKYHSDECLKIATNRRIMEKYYANKAKKNGGPRFCAKCVIPLSRYNENDLCAVHQAEANSMSRSALLELVGFDYCSTV